MGLRDAIVLGALGAALAAAPAMAGPQVVTLGGDTTGDNDPVAACGALAASPYEAGWEGRGLKDKQIFLNGAQAACEGALQAAPDSAEVKAWLARVYVLIGRRAEAEPMLRDAADAGNALAAYELARLLADPNNGDPGQAVVLLQQAAEAGYVPALDDLAARYQAGDGVDGDPAAALKLYRQAADKGDGTGLYHLGLAYQNGAGVPQDFGRAMTLYQDAAGAGEPLGFAGLGGLYQNGQGVKADNAKAAEFYQQGADQGEPQSETALAYFYEQGIAVAQSYPRSFELLTDAANQNYGFAQAALSLHYLFGQGTEVDATRALNLAMAAQQKHVGYAEGIVGYMYAEGLGTGRDLATALTYFQNGAAAGDQFSQRRIDITNLEIACQDQAGSPYEPGGIGHGVEFSALDPDAAIAACQAAIEANPDSVGDKVWLARALLKAKRLDEAIPMLKAGADKANVLAQVTYADLLLNGVGVDADPAEAIRLYQAAADQYYAPAQYALGTVYQEGAGVDADVAQAAYWYKRALDSGLDIAQAKLDELEGTTEAKASFDMTGFGREGPAY